MTLRKIASTRSFSPGFLWPPPLPGRASRAYCVAPKQKPQSLIRPLGERAEGTREWLGKARVGCAVCKGLGAVQVLRGAPSPWGEYIRPCPSCVVPKQKATGALLRARWEGSRLWTMPVWLATEGWGLLLIERVLDKEKGL